MTKIFGFTYNRVNSFVIGFGKKCLCFNIYMAKVPKRRLKGYWYIINAKDVVWHSIHNYDKLFVIGYMSIDKKDFNDLED